MVNKASHLEIVDDDYFARVKSEAPGCLPLRLRGLASLAIRSFSIPFELTAALRQDDSLDEPL